jgi:PAS domain S-box-containing protein
MKEPVKILFVEDVPADAEIIWHEISKNKIEFEKVLVETRKDYIAALKTFKPDLIISDYSLPQFDGMTALILKNDITPLTPFILVTGSINEEIAVESMKSGADDYVIKQNLSRLGPAIRAAMTKTEVTIKKETAEKELKESEERFKMLFERAPVGYQSLDENGNILEVNETWLEMMGYSKEEVIGNWFGDFLIPEYTEAFRERFSLFKEWGKVHSEFVMNKKDGSQITVAFDGRVGHTAEGNFKQTHCVLEDVTNLRLAEETLRESEERFHLAVANSPVPIMIHDEDDKVLLLSKGWIELSGYSIDEIPTMGDWTEKAYGERNGSKKDYIDDLFNINKTVHNGEWTIRTKDGNERIWEFHTTPLGRVNRGKRVLHSLAIDITEWKNAEKALNMKIDELEQFNDLTVDRELKMINLKREVNDLLKQQGKSEKYKIIE